MNIFAGRIEDGFFHGPGGCTFKLFGRAARATACDVHLGVRPEFLDIVSPESDGIPGEIVPVEPTGTRRHAYSRHSGWEFGRLKSRRIE